MKLQLAPWCDVPACVTDLGCWVVRLNNASVPVRTTPEGPGMISTAVSAAILRGTKVQPYGPTPPYTVQSDVSK